jgi:hypothetical protein
MGWEPTLQDIRKQDDAISLLAFANPNRTVTGRIFQEAPSHNQCASISAPATSRHVLKAAIAASILSMIQPSQGAYHCAKNQLVSDADNDGSKFVSGSAAFRVTKGAVHNLQF